ncbi:MAG: hypothetical protein PHG19_04050 [Anaerotignum sp.]|nr:hypothetical protein [Anaerotignum sp.]
MICDRCYFNTNCQYIGRNKKSKVSGCSCFKDRDLVVELPCKFGEQLYSIRTRYDSNKLMIGKALTVNARNLGFVITNYGTTLFRKEEAQRKIDEIKR